MAKLRTQTATNTSTNIKPLGAVDVLVANITNRHSAIIFVKFYDSSVATFQDTPIFTIQVAATSQLTLQRNEVNLVLFSTGNGMCFRVVTDNTDSGNTAAGTLPIIELEYK